MTPPVFSTDEDFRVSVLSYLKSVDSIKKSTVLVATTKGYKGKPFSIIFQTVYSIKSEKAPLVTILKGSCFFINSRNRLEVSCAMSSVPLSTCSFPTKDEYNAYLNIPVV